MKPAVVALALCSFVSSLAIAATEVSHNRYRDETARAEYSWIEGGCVSSQLMVLASKTKMKSDGVTVDAIPLLTLTFSSHSFCDLNNPEQTFWSGTAENAAVDVSSNLHSAYAFAGSISVSGFVLKAGQITPLTKNVSVSLTWSSNDPIDKYAGTFVTRYPGYYEINHLTGLYRLASATGTISDGVKSWLPDASAAYLVQLFRVNQGETILVKE